MREVFPDAGVMALEHRRTIGRAPAGVHVGKVERERLDPVRRKRPDHALHPRMILAGARAMGEYDCAAGELHGGIVSQKNLLHEGVKVLWVLWRLASPADARAADLIRLLAQVRPQVV